ncbi:Myocyte-specific enhancer factor 2C [Liparis tanakae]|uniref:Myocyte-specific enhancer factor 2C n=1 Tax=Liparis tanakae TaxID=230148 RepID=A0A4Z2G862_9TELE|nr:Myocyte-specific enhancer factor 2C [Liparis tanakae]
MGTHNLLPAAHLQRSLSPQRPNSTGASRTLQDKSPPPLGRKPDLRTLMPPNNNNNNNNKCNTLPSITQRMSSPVVSASPSQLMGGFPSPLSSPYGSGEDASQD